MAFTTWTALKTEIENDLATKKWQIKSYTLPDGVSRTFVSVDELLKMYSFVSGKAAEESGACVGRTYAKQGGGGRW